MSNAKKAGIVFAVLVVVITIAIVFRAQWLPILDGFLTWIQKTVGFADSQIWHISNYASSM